MGKYLRNPKTNNERKRVSKKYTRAKRRSLPSNWDDIVRSDLFDRNWKRKSKKRKQYE